MLFPQFTHRHCSSFVTERNKVILFAILERTLPEMTIQATETAGNTLEITALFLEGNRLLLKEDRGSTGVEKLCIYLASLLAAWQAEPIKPGNNREKEHRGSRTCYCHTPLSGC